MYTVRVSVCVWHVAKASNNAFNYTHSYVMMSLPGKWKQASKQAKAKLQVFFLLLNIYINVCVYEHECSIFPSFQYIDKNARV